MVKRIARSRPSTNKAPTPSPNQRYKKQTNTTSPDATTASNDPAIVENQMNDLHFLDKFNASIAEAKPGDVSGGRPLWSNLVAPPRQTWHQLDQLLKTNETPYSMLDKFKEGDGLHDLAHSGKNLRGVTGKGYVLTAEGWRILFKELYEEKTDLAKSSKVARLRIFGLRLALTEPKGLFEGAEWVVYEEETIGLQSSLLTDAWTGAYVYFGAPWKQVDSFTEYLAPPGKPKARPSLKNHSFFDAGKALKDTQASNDITAADPITLSDDEDMADPSEVTIVGVVEPLTAPATSPAKKQFGFARQLYIQKAKVTTNPLIQPKINKWNDSRKISKVLKIRTCL